MSPECPGAIAFNNASDDFNDALELGRKQLDFLNERIESECDTAKELRLRQLRLDLQKNLFDIASSTIAPSPKDTALYVSGAGALLCGALSRIPGPL